ncbi:MAG: hypothetical protein EHM55_01510 [Acidobacteria bacterium]|nr:MAG: hypothetical protein EHM55_01510 [Acidobacteriota bacterium]
MKTVPLAGLAVAALLLVQPPIAALTEELTDRDITNALNLANNAEATRARFHAPYIIPLDEAIVERLEVITEFRRFVLAAEEQLQLGNWMLGRGGFDQKGRTLKDLLKPFAGQASIRARLRFHPHNSYVTLPAFDIMLGDPTLAAQQAIRTPHIVPASGDRNTRDFIAGATIEMTFDARSIQDRALPVRIVSEGRELARVTVDFSRLQ